MGEKKMQKYKRSGKRWTKEEDQELLDLIGTSQINYISSKLGRTEEAIYRRLERVGVRDITQHTGRFSTWQLADILQVDPKTITRWIHEEDLPAKQLWKNRIKDSKRRHYYIAPHEFWKWAKTHQHLINFHTIKRKILLPEPNWLEYAIQQEKKAKRHQRLWTLKEDEFIWKAFYEKGMSQQEIGDHIGRSRRAVQRRLSRLRRQKQGGRSHAKIS